MASFQKRGKLWEYRINRIVNGVRRPIQKGGFITKKEAQVAATEIENKLNKGIAPHLKLEPLDEYFENWIEIFKPDIAKNTKARYLNTLETLRERFAGVPLQHITKRTYQSFLNDYGATRSKETVRKLNTHVRACVKDAIEEGIIHVDFTRSVSMSGGKVSKSSVEKHLSFVDSERLINKITERLSSTSSFLILLALSSGLRFAELVGLTRKDFDFDKNELKVTKTWGYTNKMHEGFGPTKNPQSVRTIKIDQNTMSIFKTHFSENRDNRYGLVFYSSESKYKVISNNAVNKLLEQMLEALKIQTISVHGLRHTHASILLYKGVSIYYVSERLGHGDIETTMSYYAHIIKELRERDEQSTTQVFESLIK